MPIDPNMLLNAAIAIFNAIAPPFIARGSTWHERIGTDEQLRAALLLHDSGLCVACMLAYANACRAVYLPLQTYNAAWSRQRREEAERALQEFVSQHTIYPALQIYSASIERYSSEDNDVWTEAEYGATTAITEAANAMLHHAIWPIRAQKTNLIELTNLTDPAAGTAGVDEFAQRILRTLSQVQGQIDEATEGFATLRAHVLCRHPGLL
jgi:hypothetical protein